MATKSWLGVKSTVHRSERQVATVDSRLGSDASAEEIKLFRTARGRVALKVVVIFETPLYRLAR